MKTAIKTIIAAMACAVSATAGHAEDLRWKMPVAFATNLPGLGSPAPWVAEQLTTASGGSIQVRVYEPTELVPPFEILQAVSDGKIAAGYTWIGYDQGKVPAVPLFAAMPFGLKPWAYAGWYFYGGGHEMLQETYANKGFNVHAQLCGIVGPETAGWYKQPITSLDDYKGMKIRFSGIGGLVLERLGASVTLLPAGELFQALELGTLDATEFSIPAVDTVLGFDKLVKNNLFPGWHQTFTAQYMLINKDEWAKTTDAQKSLIETTCTAGVMRGLAESEYLNGSVVADLAEKGINIGSLPHDILVDLRNLTNEVLEAEAAKDEDFARVLKSQKEFQAIYSQWDSIAYVPNDLLQ